MIQAHAHVYATARSCRAQPGGQLPRRRKSETNPMTARTKTTTMTMKIVPMTNLSLDPAAAEEKHDEDNDHEDEEEAQTSPKFPLHKWLGKPTLCRGPNMLPCTR